jgi:hypothetical protein
MTFEPDSDVVPPAIGDLFSGSSAFGAPLKYAVAFLFIDSPFAQRIKLALELTSNADSVANRAIALSLCLSSLEALLCKEDRDKKNSTQVRERVPAVLQADQKLAEEAGEAIRMLYRVRNRCLHGQEVSTQHGVSAVRRLVGAILRGVLEWAVYTSDDAANLDDDEWIQELEAAATTPNRPAQIAGITKDLVEHLQTFTNVFGKDRLKAEWPEIADRD